MQRFWEFAIKPAVDAVNAKHIIEIGADTGLNTGKLLQYCVVHQAKLTSIDPVPNFDYQAWQQQFPQHFSLVQDLSLNAILRLEPCDIALIDGDHNWYTVFNELIQIEALNRNANRPFPLVFFHDIGWPYARRDMYYAPDNIPAEFRQPYRQAGMLMNQSALAEKGGFNAGLCNAEHEGGERNGVLTAVEDFIEASALNLHFELIHGLHGLGILFENTPENHQAFDFNQIQRQVAMLTEYERLHLLQLFHF